MKQKFVLLVFFCLALVSCATSPDIKTGDRFFKEGNWDDAVESYREAVKKNPQDADLHARFTQAKIRSAALHYLKGVELSRAKSYDEAISEIKRSVNLDPSRVEYQTGLIRATRLKESEEQFRIGQTLLKAGRLEQAEEAFGKAAALNLENEAAKEALVSVGVALEAVRDEGSGLSLKSSEPITLKFHNARIKEVFELLSKTAGINILFDKDVRDDNITIFIKDASFKETLNLILATNSLFMKKISEDTILIIPKNKQKVDQYQDLMIRTFYLSAVKTEDMVALLQKMLEIRKIQANKELNAITIRETPDKIKLAEKIIEANDRKPPEVMLELEVMEVQESGELKYGFNFPGSFPGANPNEIGAQMGGTTSGGITTFQPGRIDLATLKNLNDQAFQFIIPSVYVDFLKTDSNAKTLANPKVRVLDGKKAVINIGDKVPILLSSTTAPAVAGSLVQATTSTNTQFQDVGIKVTAVPDIHLNNEITLKLELEVSSLGN
ncbi:MAG TPA: tetratricopeptide repeat protein, partial [Nitrospiria bacterium]|nr:tetratricopeptide repeat protein [Nitrospiria bacterium]